MSTWSFQTQVRGLEDELTKAEQHIYQLERKQRKQIDDLEVEYKTRLEQASGDLFRFIKCIWEADARLLEDYSGESEDSELEDHLENAEDVIKSLNKTVEESFRELEQRLTTGEHQLMVEQEKATEEGTARMGILTGKIADTQTNIKRQISDTETDIRTSTKEKGDAEDKRSRLQSDLGGMEKRLSQLDTRRDVVIGTTVGGSIMAVLGAFITPVFPPAGIGMIAAGSSMAVGSGITIADTEDKMKFTKTGISNTSDKIETLRKKIESLIAKVPQLRTELNLFDGLMNKVKSLAEKTTSLHRVAHKHVQTIIAAKDSISVCGRKIVELNVHMQLGYVDTREDLAGTLKTVVEKLGHGRLQLEGKMGSPQTSEMLVMVGDIAADTDNVLAIMDRV